LQTKVTELAAAITAADSRLKETNVRLESANRDVAAAAERVKSLEGESQKLAGLFHAAQKAAAPAEKDLADASHAVARWQDEIAFRDQMAALTKDLDAARKVVADRQSVLDKANKQLAAVQTTVSAAKAKVDEASHGVDAVADKIRRARGKQ
jgi:chromosome segregation ATPase